MGEDLDKINDSASSTEDINDCIHTMPIIDEEQFHLVWVNRLIQDVWLLIGWFKIHEANCLWIDVSSRVKPKYRFIINVLLIRCRILHTSPERSKKKKKRNTESSSVLTTSGAVVLFFLQNSTVAVGEVHLEKYVPKSHNWRQCFSS